MNVIVCGSRGSGKSSLIRRMLREETAPIYGFWTEKLAPDPDGRCPVYLHGCREPLSYTSDHLIGYATERGVEKHTEIFETLGVCCLQNIPEGSLVLMDEIGVMESEAKRFIAAIFRVLDGNYRVIAAVRDRDTPLLCAVRQHPKSRCIRAERKRKE